MILAETLNPCSLPAGRSKQRCESKLHALMMMLACYFARQAQPALCTTAEHDTWLCAKPAERSQLRPEGRPPWQAWHGQIK